MLPPPGLPPAYIGPRAEGDSPLGRAGRPGHEPGLGPGPGPRTTGPLEAGARPRPGDRARTGTAGKYIRRSHCDVWITL
jgi:hypothetical protein